MKAGLASRLRLIPNSSTNPSSAIRLVFWSNPTAWLVSDGKAMRSAWGNTTS